MDLSRFVELKVLSIPVSKPKTLQGCPTFQKQPTGDRQPSTVNRQPFSVNCLLPAQISLPDHFLYRHVPDPAFQPGNNIQIHEGSAFERVEFIFLEFIAQ